MTLLAGQIPTALELNAGPSTYVPQLTAVTSNPVLGTGSTQLGWWYRFGQQVIGGATIRFGTSGATFGSGAYIISLPVAAESTLQRINQGAGLTTIVGNASLRDNSPLRAWLGHAYLFSTTSVVISSEGGGNADFDTPFTWAASDAMTIQFSYLAQL